MVRQRLNIVFSKKGLMRFISHLDMARLFQRAARRAGLPLTMTEGFSPRPKMSFKRALKLGIESDKEEVSFYINGWMNPEEFKRRLQAELPEGIGISSVKTGETCAKKS
jgi:radical SAM-linked protein